MSVQLDSLDRYENDTRKRVLAFVRNHIKAKGYAPSVREISRDVGVNVSTVHWHLGHLRKEGKLEWNDGQVRTLRVPR